MKPSGFKTSCNTLGNINEIKQFNCQKYKKSFPTGWDKLQKIKTLTDHVFVKSTMLK